jgi:urease accessory protein
VAASPAAAPAPAEPTSTWHGRLDLRYRRAGARTVAHDRHEGPLRVLQALYPEGEGICHHVLVHPPGGIVGGDRLEIDLALGPGTHALVTTPGATRFYRGGGRHAAQTARLVLEAGARLEWLPLETIAYPGCDAVNAVQFELGPGAALLGWDVLALGMPASGAPFERGCIEQRLCWPAHWLERARIDAADAPLLDGPLGLDGQRALGTLWFASAEPWPPTLRERLLDAARELAEGSPLAARCGVTPVLPGLAVLRVLAPRVEPVWQLLRAVRAAWRDAAWGLAESPPRVWRT